jgi:hypothetical protein
MIQGLITRQMFLDRIFQDDQDRLDHIRRAWDYYEGKHPAMLKVIPGAPDDNVTMNLARGIVDRGISFLFGKELEWQFDETDATTTPAEQQIDAIWDANNKMTLLHEVGQNGFLAGYAAIKVAPQQDGSIRLINLNPAELRLFSAPDDCDDVYRYVIKYVAENSQGNEIHHAEVIERQGPRGSSWTVTNYRALGGEKAYRPDGAPIDWPYALAPIQYCKNLPRANCPYGYGDLDDPSLMDALNLTLSATRKTLRLFPDPQDIIEGGSAKGLVRGGANIWELAQGTAKRLEMNAGALDAARQHAIDLRAAIFSQARMTDMATIGERLGQVTNFGLKVLFLDFLNLNDTKRILYGGLINRVNQLLALILGLGDIETSFIWPDPLPTNELEHTQAIAAKQATGLVSEEDLTNELGYDYDDQQKRLEDERAARAAIAPNIPPVSMQQAPAAPTMPPAGPMPPQEGM